MLLASQPASQFACFDAVYIDTGFAIFSSFLFSPFFVSFFYPRKKSIEIEHRRNKHTAKRGESQLVGAVHHTDDPLHIFKMQCRSESAASILYRYTHTVKMREQKRKSFFSLRFFLGCNKS